MMQVCTIASGHTFSTTSGSPFNPSQTRKNTSRTPRFFKSTSTLIGKLGALTTVAHPQAQDVFAAVHRDADSRINGPVSHLTIPDFDHDRVNEHRHIHGVQRPVAPFLHSRDHFIGDPRDRFL